MLNSAPSHRFPNKKTDQLLQPYPTRVLEQYDIPVESHESRNGAGEDFLETAQSLPSVCLK